MLLAIDSFNIIKFCWKFFVHHFKYWNVQLDKVKNIVRQVEIVYNEQFFLFYYLQLSFITFIQQINNVNREKKASLVWGPILHETAYLLQVIITT